MINLARKICVILLLPILGAIFLSPLETLAAAKEVTLMPSMSSVEVGQKLEVKINIDTGTDPVGAVGFDISYPTEILQAESNSPSNSGSVLPMPGGTQSATRYECGIVGKAGFTGIGLITTLVFKVKTAGTALIEIKNFEARYGPTGAQVEGFTVKTLSINTYGVGQTPTDTSTGEAASASGPPEKIAPEESGLKPSNDAMTIPILKNINTVPGRIKGSLKQVNGRSGANKEDVLKASEDNTKVSVKGSAFKNPLYYGLLPTVLLIVLVVNLAIKLYFTEKKRHLELVHLFDSHLGTLSSLESKLDLVDQKVEGGKERIIQEFEQAKNELTTEEKSKLSILKS